MESYDMNNNEILEAEIDILFSDLESMNVNTQKLRLSRMTMRKEELVDALKELLRKYGTEKKKANQA